MTGQYRAVLPRLQRCLLATVAVTLCWLGSQSAVADSPDDKAPTLGSAPYGATDPFTANAGDDKPHDTGKQDEGNWLFIKGSTDKSAIFPLIRAFQEQHPSIQVRYEEVLSPQLYMDFRSEYLHRATTTDIIISSAMDLQAKLINDGYARPYDSANTDDLPDWAKWRHEGFGFAFEPLVMVYNKAAFKDQTLPRTHEELATQLREQPALYQQKVGTYDIRLSGVGYMLFTQDAVHSSINGRLLESLGRADVQTFCCTSLILDAVASGKLILGYNVLGSYSLSRALQDPRLGVIIPSDYTLAMSPIALISKKASSPKLAQQFIDFLLSVEGQDDIANHSGLISLLGDGPRSANGIRLNYESSYHPISLGLGLLVYLDQMKRNRFLHEWESVIQPGSMIQALTNSDELP
ncbi:ABC transporter substrate-binding protein [Pokkaliibacter plantistimulans]|nr:ABC transporter substrate-binding protein [Pokkaliibacter plantistimulans]